MMHVSVCPFGSERVPWYAFGACIMAVALILISQDA